MYIKELIINNYRNYEKLNLEFSPNNNFIIGDNGQGKTNLIESIYLLGMAKSFRISTDKDLIRKGKDYFYVKGKYYYENNEDDYLNDELHTVELGYDGKKKQAKYNGEIVKRLSDWIGNLKTVVFLNQDIDLILGSASQRRRYMDMVISLGNRNYLINLQKYMKVLKSRNKMLKEEKKIFDIYDEQLISYGSEIIYKRMKLFEEIKHDARNIFKMINPDIQNFKLDYKPNIGKPGLKEPSTTKESSTTIEEIKSHYKNMLEKNKDKALIYKTTVTGPHRDDFNIKNDREKFKKFASQGQNRAGALTLKMIAIKHIENASGQKAILLLDDILLDLDANKKNLFLKLVEKHQCFFTSTTKKGIGDIQSAKNNKIFYIEKGKVINE